MTTAATDRETKILGIIERTRAKQKKFRDERINMAHGAGGKATGSLIEGVLAPAFGMTELADSGSIAGTDMVMTTDAFVVKPLVFPGGSIGELAVNGTCNDVAMAGARPLALSLSLILEEGLDADTLRREVDAIAAAAAAAGVSIITGDTKVVERGKADGMYITTTGVGHRDPRASLSPSALRPGDRLLVSDRIGDHGTAIMLARGEFELGATIESDTKPLWPLVDALFEAVGGPGRIRCLRDATRGGVASVLNELARASGVAMLIEEAHVPVDPMVVGASELLGIDPMHVANEGVFVAAVAPEHVEAALAALGPQARDIGEVRTGAGGGVIVLVKTAFGGTRVMDQLVGDPLPRIC